MTRQYRNEKALTARRSFLSRRKEDLPSLKGPPRFSTSDRQTKLSYCRRTRWDDRITDDHDAPEALLLSNSRYGRPFHVFPALPVNIACEAILEEKEAPCFSQYRPCDRNAYCDSDGIYQTHNELYDFVPEQGWKGQHEEDSDGYLCHSMKRIRVSKSPLTWRRLSD